MASYHLVCSICHAMIPEHLMAKHLKWHLTLRTQA